MSPPQKPHTGPGYGVVEPTDGRGLRFVAWCCTEACAAALCAVARQHGHAPASTAGWLTQSSSQSEPKGK